MSMAGVGSRIVAEVWGAWVNQTSDVVWIPVDGGAEFEPVVDSAVDETLPDLSPDDRSTVNVHPGEKWEASS